MENASKALLIAAAVLIVIILIAFGMSVLNSPKDTVEHAQGVGDSISDASQTALGKLEASFNKGQTIDVSSMLTEEQKRGDADITSAQLAKIILGDENKSLGTYNGDWRVIGQNVTENGKTYSYKLVSTDVVEKNVKLGHEDPKVTGSNNLERAISSYNRAVTTLNEAAEDALVNISDNGKVEVRSITIEDIDTLLGKSHEQGEKYKYMYSGGKIYRCSYVGGFMVGGGFSSFYDNQGNKIDSANSDQIITLISDYYSYDFSMDEENKYSYIIEKNAKYWLASPCVRCNESYADFIVRYVYNGSIDGTVVFPSIGNGFTAVSRGVRAVVCI